jgi:hypothetical protein
MFVIKQNLHYERKMPYLTEYKKPLHIRYSFYSEHFIRNIILLLGQQRGQNSSPSRGMILLLFMSSRLVLRPTQPPIQWVPRPLSPGVKLAEHEADHSPPTSAEVKNM